MLMAFAAVIVRRRGYAASHARFLVAPGGETPDRGRAGRSSSR